MSGHLVYIEPVDVVQMVEEYVDARLRDAEKFDNVEPLDESWGWFTIASVGALTTAYALTNHQRQVWKLQDKASALRVLIAGAS